MPDTHSAEPQKGTDMACLDGVETLAMANSVKTEPGRQWSLVDGTMLPRCGWLGLSPAL